MTDDLVKRPVLRIYTEATSDKGGIWAFEPYTYTHVVFVEESNYLDLKARIEALTAQLQVSNELGKALEEDAGQLREDNARLRAALECLLIEYDYAELAQAEPPSLTAAVFSARAALNTGKADT